ncbi:unnamed protein product [Rhizoctonia solani]|uniref:Uncharacterized protein n=1 Tax=Rhizoctonia solani TaxID=456999 RepID=A0A8H2X9R7_9AGAM|nr:unnamed protein product [Rhizoctonia solani]CAE6512209.1 unnamed protein product [Rhizoctonia solani]
MQPGDTHEIHSGAHLSKIPDDVTHLIAQFSSFEVLASLVRCNKSLYRSCTPLLFREIRLYKPIQLVRLCRNREALQRLSETKSMFLEESLFFPYCWGDTWISAEAVQYFITAFRTATSLLRLQIFDAPAPNIVPDNLITRLRSMSSDPTLLPKLEVLIGIRSVSLRSLHENRPVKFICSYEDFDNIVIETYPSLSRNSLISSATPPTLLEQAQDLSAAEIGTFIRESKGNLLAKYDYLNFTARFPEAIKNAGDAPIPNLFTWLQEVFQEANLSSDNIKRLTITFEPSPSHLSSWEQHTIITKVSELLPTLERVQLASLLIWHRYNSVESSQDSLSLWTPEPDYFSIGWWLDALHIRPTSTKTQEEAKHIVMQLREGMCKRYPPGRIPSVNFLVKHVLSFYNYT